MGVVKVAHRGKYMKEILEKANQALLEGDRDGVLRLLQNERDTADVIWLRANSVLSDGERMSLLSQLTNGNSPYANLARDFLSREQKFEWQLSEPPDYQFWKQRTWAKRLEKMLAYKMWVVGGIVLIFLGIFGLIVNGRYEQGYQQQVIAVQSTQTAQAFIAGNPIAVYPEGSISIISVEDPTTRPVSYGQMQDDKYIAGEPPKGARFVAVQINFL